MSARRQTRPRKIDGKGKKFVKAIEPDEEFTDDNGTAVPVPEALNPSYEIVLNGQRHTVNTKTE